MQILRIYSIALFLALSFGGFGQISFFKIFTNNGYDFGQGAVQLEDSSYVICGSSSSFTNGPSQAFLLRIDSLGNYMWSQHYGGNESEWGRRVLYKKNFGYFLTGHTNSSGNGAYDAFLMKIGENGVLEWQQTYGGTEWEKINDAALTRDTGTLLVGQTNSTSGGDTDAYIIRTDKNGDTLWTKRIGGSGEDFANGITQFNDSTFFIGGETYVEDSLASKGFVIRMVDNGVIQWFDTIGEFGNCGINDVDYDPIQLKVNFVGWQLHPTLGISNSFFGKVYADGTSDFSISEPSTGKKIYDQVSKYGSVGKNYIAFRYLDETSFQDGFDLAFLKAGSSLFWDGIMLLLQYPLEDVTGQLIPTSDGGLLAVGYTSYYGAGGGNVFVVKIGPNDLYPTVEVNPTGNPLVWISENTMETDVLVYPNPAEDHIVISTQKESILNFTIQDMNGKILAQDSLYKSIELQTQIFESGMYILTLRSEDGVDAIQRIVIR